MTAAVLRSYTINEEAVTAALRNIYWLVIKYNSLTQLQGCDHISHLRIGRNAKYSSPKVVKEMQLAISNCIKEKVAAKLCIWHHDQ